MYYTKLLKKILIPSILLCIGIMMLMPIKLYAEGETVTMSANGEALDFSTGSPGVKKGDTIDLTINNIRIPEPATEDNFPDREVKLQILFSSPDFGTVSTGDPWIIELRDGKCLAVPITNPRIEAPFKHRTEQMGIISCSRVNGLYQVNAQIYTNVDPPDGSVPVFQEHEKNEMNNDLYIGIPGASSPLRGKIKIKPTNPNTQTGTEGAFEIFAAIPNPVVPGRDQLKIILKKVTPGQNYRYTLDYFGVGIDGTDFAVSGDNVYLEKDQRCPTNIEELGVDNNCTLKDLYVSPLLLNATSVTLEPPKDDRDKEYRKGTVDIIVYEIDERGTVSDDTPRKTFSLKFTDPVTPTPFPPPCQDVRGRILISSGKCTGLQTAFGIVHTEPGTFVSRVLVFLLGISGAIALVLIIRSSYMLITSRGDAEKVEQAKEILTAAIVGLLFIIFSLVIIEVITVDVLKIPGFSK